MLLKKMTQTRNDINYNLSPLLLAAHFHNCRMTSVGVGNAILVSSFLSYFYSKCTRRMYALAIHIDIYSPRSTYLWINLHLYVSFMAKTGHLSSFFSSKPIGYYRKKRFSTRNPIPLIQSHILLREPLYQIRSNDYVFFRLFSTILSLSFLEKLFQMHLNQSHKKQTRA